jgi:hypothetical protein
LIQDLIDHFRGNGLTYPNKPGDGFGGPGTSTISGNDVDNGFTGRPVNDPYGWGGPDATFPGRLQLHRPDAGRLQRTGSDVRARWLQLHGPMQQPASGGDTGTHRHELVGRVDHGLRRFLRLR